MICQTWYQNVNIGIDPFAALAVISGACVALWAYWKKHAEKRKKREEKSISVVQNSIAAERLSNILYDLLIQWECTRCFIIEFHNGVDNDSGISRRRMTIEKEKRSNIQSVSMISIAYDDVETPETIHKIILYLQMKKQQSFYVKSSADPVLTHTYGNEQGKDLLMDNMELFSIVSFNYVALYNKEGNIVSLLGMTWDKATDFSTKTLHNIESKKREIETVYHQIRK